MDVVGSGCGVNQQQLDLLIRERMALHKQENTDGWDPAGVGP